MSLSTQDKELIAKLRDDVKDLLVHTPKYNTDFNLYRWLKGYNYDYAAIVPRLRQHLKFHIAADLENYEDKIPHPIVKEYYPFGMLDTTGLDNNFVFIETLGRLDVEGLLSSVPETQILLTRIYDSQYVMKRLQEQEAKTGQQSSLMFVVDLDGLKYDVATFVNLVTGPYRALVDFFAAHYAEMIGKIVIVNGPSFMYYAWKMFSPILPAKTRDKVQILSSNWKTELQQFATAASLPVHWGGKLCDPDGNPMCPSRITVPEKIPLECRAKLEGGSPEQTVLLNGGKTLHLNAGKTEFVSIHIEKFGLRLSWQICADVNYSFGVFFSTNDSETDTEKMDMAFPFFELLPAPMPIPDEGSLECKRLGFYKLKFGNDHSWFHTMKITYCVKISS